VDRELLLSYTYFQGDIMTHKQSVPLHWRRIQQRYNLIGNKCTNCGEVYFPPRAVCKNCRSKGELDEVKLSGKGNIHSYTVIRSPPEYMKLSAPYIVAIVELEEGPKISAQIEDAEAEDIEIGSKVEHCFRKVNEAKNGGIVKYGFKFQVVD